jgi:tetratricopeptide (TPR) repeat protein
MNADIEKGLMLLRAQRLADAEQIFDQILLKDPTNFDALHIWGVVEAQRENWGRALVLLERARQLKPASPLVLSDRGVVLMKTGRYDEALAHFEQALKAAPDSLSAAYGRALSLLHLERFETCVDACRAVLALQPSHTDAMLHQGRAFRALGRHADSAECFKSAVAHDSASVEGHNELAVAHIAMKQYDRALASCDRALALNPNLPHVIYNRGLALANLHRTGDAVAAFKLAASFYPSVADDVFVQLGTSLAAEGRLNEACASFLRYCDLLSRRPPVEMPPFRVRHDLEQLDYLASMGKCPAALEQARAESTHAAKGWDVFSGYTIFDGGQRLARPALNPRSDARTAEETWAGSSPKIVVIDDLLNEGALHELQRFCWGSTIWRNNHVNSYLGAVPETGFACPLIAQIGEEIRSKYSRIIGAYHLIKWWGFKYDSTLTGIRIHADFAAVNVNFWITPDEANLDPDSGGLVLWDVPAPLDWNFEDYNVNETAIRALLNDSGAKSITVPYRANRAIMFDSDLFHATDRFTFKPGYKNRRLNITMLYGLREMDETR